MKRAPNIQVAGIALDRGNPQPLAEQLYTCVRRAILSGQLRASTRLPATRVLAQELGVSRNTVVSAFEQLGLEGYLDARIGSGTHVASCLPDELLNVHAQLEPRRTAHARIRLSRRGRELAHSPVRVLSVPGRPRPFASGHPDVMEFPLNIWSTLAARRWRSGSRDLLTYGDPAGYFPLRKAIADYVRTARAVRCEPEQVVIVSGSQQAIDLLARLLVEIDDVVLVEDPGYLGARSAFRAASASVLPLPVDPDGANINGIGQNIRRRVRLAFVTPSHQYPLGVTMTLQRRLALLEWAREQDAFILEDDYDSDFRYRGKPLPSLQGLDNAARVIYMGSFSKTILPSLRLGFLVLPDNLVEPFRRARAVLDGHSPTPYQAVLADFIAEGHFARHIRKMRSLYAERQSALVEAAHRELKGVIEIDRSDGGMHVVGWLPPGVNDRSASHTAGTHGVYASPLSACALGRLTRGGLLLGFAAFSPKQICEAVARLAPALSYVVRKGTVNNRCLTPGGT
jgi:GntR family transcriptional regulator/MocR family aminotransferase